MQTSRRRLNPRGPFPDDELDLSAARKQISLNSRLNARESRGIGGINLEFTGRAQSLCKIWLSGWVLSLLTFGAYLPFMLCQTRRYLFAHLSLDGHGFRFLGSVTTSALLFLFPLVTILSIAAALLTGQGLIPVLVLLTMVILPVHLHYKWVSLCRLTAYRNVRFYFTGDVKETVIRWCLGCMLVLCSFGLALPWVKRRWQSYLVDNTWFGDNQSVTMPRLRDAFAPIWAGVSLFAMGICLLTLITPMEALTRRYLYIQPVFNETFLGLSAGLFLTLALSATVYRTMNIRNYLRNSEILSVAIFSFRRNAMPVYFCELTCTLLMVCSAGLLYPWLTVWRMTIWSRVLIVRIKPGVNVTKEMPHHWYCAHQEEKTFFRTLWWRRKEA